MQTQEATLEDATADSGEKRTPEGAPARLNQKISTSGDA